MLMSATDSRIQSAVPRSSTPFSRIHSAKVSNSPPILYVIFTLSPYTSRRRCRIGSRPHDHQHHGSAKWTISIGTSSLDTLSPRARIRGPRLKSSRTTSRRLRGGPHHTDRGGFLERLHRCVDNR